MSFYNSSSLPVPCEWVDQVPDFFKADMCFKIVCMGYIHNVKGHKPYSNCIAVVAIIDIFHILFNFRSGGRTATSVWQWNVN